MNWPHGRTDDTVAYLVIILSKDKETLQEGLNELAAREDRWHYCLPCYHPAEGHRHLYRKTLMNWLHGRTDDTIAYLVIILPKDTETLQEDLNELATWEDR